MPRSLFPDRIETDRLVFERLDRERVDVHGRYEFVRRGDWQDDATEHTPWFRFHALDDVPKFLESAEQQRADRETLAFDVDWG